MSQCLLASALVDWAGYGKGILMSAVDLSLREDFPVVNKAEDKAVRCRAKRS